MNRFCLTIRWAAVSLAVVLVTADGLAAAPATRRLAPLRLRGYGELSAQFTSDTAVAGGPVSSLVITCESEAKAGLVLAKFVGDLPLLGEVKDGTLAVAGLPVPVYAVPQQGAVGAFRQGKVVTILASPTTEGLSAVLTAWQRQLAGAELVPRTKVPMFLEAWDRHGFRFYYWPFQQPRGTEWRNYNPLAEFDFAQRCNESGLVIWSGDERCDFADGLSNESFWNWAGRAASRRKLPLVVNTLPLTADWKIKPLPDDAPADQSALAAPDLDDRAWEKADLGNWLVPEERPSHRALFRRRFTVPADWRDGQTKLWIKSWVHEAVRGRLRAWLDGQPIADGNSVTAYDATATLQPRSTHLLAVEFKSEGQVAGCIGNAWLTHLPRPKNQLELAGDWTPSADGLAWGEAVKLPGPWNGWSMARRRVAVAAAWSGQTAMIQLETETQSGFYGVMVNGRLVRRLHHEVGTVTRLNVTPWIQFGQENELHLTRASPGKGAIKRISLDFFEPGTTP